MKFSKKYCLNLAITQFFSGLMIFFVLLTSFTPEESESIVITKESLIITFIVTFIYIIFSIIYNILSYKCISYEFKEDCVELKKGIIFKKHQIIRYDKINAIDVKRPLISLILGTALLNIDSGSTVSHQAEISIFHEREVIEQLENRLKRIINKEEDVTPNELEIKEDIQEEKVQNDNEYVYTFKKKFLSLCLSFGFWFGMLIVFLGLCSTFIASLEQYELSDIVIAILIGLLLTLAFTVVSFIFGIVSTILHYFKYTIKKEKNALVIEFGLLSKVKHTIGYNKIKGVTIKQNLLQRAFKYASISLEVVGFLNEGTKNDGENQQFSGVFIPLCKLNQVESILNEYLPEYSFKNPEYRSLNSTYKFYITTPIVILSIILFPFLVLSIFNYYFLVSIIVYVLCILLTLLFSICKLKCQGIDYNQKFIYVSNGIFTKKTLIISRKSLIGVGKKTTKNRDKEGVLSLYIDYYNTAFKNRETVAMVNQNIYNELKKLL